MGLDPGLTYTGWAIVSTHPIERFVCKAYGRIQTSVRKSISERLVHIHDVLLSVCETWMPHCAAIEQIFVNSNPVSSLKLGLARGVALMTPGRLQISVTEYSANTVKKSVTGNGHASKEQVLKMLKQIFHQTLSSYDSSDALAVALCHGFHLK
ncbi:MULTISPECIES: crossover junction endodeoxyribonuclease RuvC [Holospora]|uniref:Crossover junction endodeoxyribonuclease RuvC n=2 Tax=Holospora TaxID=44747 RepID=A0A061JGZ6_9PROT|nr:MULTISPECIES: crossover junction endodeoxyribonuclease RuvC [Holospora]ETZ04537.1 crossover junction endodeoxyribonuclease RuvC [Holospora undulata HU1]GAJ46116.1 crossover junction endodeoxyribonuclease RuvC [Holospora elegans E1]